MLTLYLVRHGQTDCSKSSRYCGEIDVPLNSNGKAVAESLAEFYGGESWEAIYSSPKLRARQTAAPLAEATGLEVRIEEGLREIAYGDWDGLLERDVKERFPEEFRVWSADPARNSPPGGESAIEIAFRVVPVIEAIRHRHPAGKVIVFSHKATIRVLVCALLGIDLSLFRARVAQAVGAVTVFEFRETGPLLKVLNDQSHVPAELRKEEGS